MAERLHHQVGAEAQTSEVLEFVAGHRTGGVLRTHRSHLRLAVRTRTHALPFGQATGATDHFLRQGEAPARIGRNLRQTEQGGRRQAQDFARLCSQAAADDQWNAAASANFIEQHLGRLSAFLTEAETGWTPRSLPEFVERELGWYAAYFQANRNAARLWLDGRVSPTVRAEVLRYNRRTARRLHGVAVAAGLAPPQTELLVFVMLVELGDRILDLAFRERRDPDPDVIRQGRIALTAYLAAALRL